jgi:hypothetical protein
LRCIFDCDLLDAAAARPDHFAVIVARRRRRGRNAARSFAAFQ